MVDILGDMLRLMDIWTDDMYIEVGNSELDNERLFDVDEDMTELDNMCARLGIGESVQGGSFSWGEEFSAHM